ncbi:MAG: polysaccharide deacetylase family protein [Wolbachia endosymbiont of Tyrophagus putrescentiae]|nr:polysaccharide deacetylase family protein [Wolbachia endosymbiont of Tyrophagus putrescentiae]
MRLVNCIISISLFFSAAFCNGCNFNTQNNGLSCNIDLSYKGLSNTKNLLKDKEDKFIALTFDDGPSYTTTSAIVDVLEAHELKATFFLLGERLNKKTYNVVKRIHETGSEIGNHSWSHRKLTSLSSDEQFQELEKTNAAISKIIKKDIKWFRPPYGCHNQNVIKHVNSLNMYSILWTIDSLDWQNDKPEVLVKRVINNVHNGAIVLLHDHERKSNTLKALPEIITTLKKSGYRFVTLSEWEEEICDLVR